MKFSVTIPAIRATTVKDAIDSIRRQTHEDWELFIVGQGGDATLQRVGRACSTEDPRVHYLHLDTPGTCRARNAGIAAGTGDFFAFIDDDCVADEKWLAVLLEYFEAHPQVDVVGGALVGPPRPPGHLFAHCPAIHPSDSLYDPVASGRKPPPGFGWIGCNFAMRRTTVEKIGPFDESLGPGTDFPCAEDTDYLLRLEASGIKMHSTPKAIVHHANGYRFGLKAVLKNARNYAWGNGGMAAKLTLLGDPRGEGWATFNRTDCLVGWLKPPRPHRVPANLLRLWNFTRSYRYCMQNYVVDKESGALKKRAVRAG